MPHHLWGHKEHNASSSLDSFPPLKVKCLVFGLLSERWRVQLTFPERCIFDSELCCIRMWLYLCTKPNNNWKWMRSRKTQRKQISGNINVLKKESKEVHNSYIVFLQQIYECCFPHCLKFSLFSSFKSCPQERFQVKNPPHTYLQKLRSYLDPAVTRKVSAPTPHPPTPCRFFWPLVPSATSSSLRPSISCSGFPFGRWEISLAGLRHGKVGYETAKVDGCVRGMAGWSGIFHWRDRALRRPSCGEDKWK